MKIKNKNHKFYSQFKTVLNHILNNQKYYKNNNYLKIFLHHNKFSYGN